MINLLDQIEGLDIVRNISEHICIVKDDEGNEHLWIDPQLEDPQQISMELESSDEFKEIREMSENLSREYEIVMAQLDNAYMENAYQLIEEIDNMREGKQEKGTPEEMYVLFKVLERILTSLVHNVDPFSRIGRERLYLLREYRRIYDEEFFVME